LLIYELLLGIIILKLFIYLKANAYIVKLSKAENNNKHKS